MTECDFRGDEFGAENIKLSFPPRDNFVLKRRDRPIGAARSVDKFEDAKAHELHRLPQTSISVDISLKQSTLKMKRFVRSLGTALGAGGRAFKSPRPDQFMLPMSRVAQGLALRN
jgi:hypothetical protein